MTRSEQTPQTDPARDGRAGAPAEPQASEQTAPPDKPEKNTTHDAWVAQVAGELVLPRILKALHIDADRIQDGKNSIRDPSTVYADAVRIVYKDGQRVMALIIEVQLGVDKDKELGWFRYYSGVYIHERCPTSLFILCPDEATTAWARAVLDGLPLKDPGVVFGPNEIGLHFPEPEIVLGLLKVLRYKRNRRLKPDPTPHLRAVLNATQSAV